MEKEAGSSDSAGYPETPSSPGKNGPAVCTPALGWSVHHSSQCTVLYRPYVSCAKREALHSSHLPPNTDVRLSAFPTHLNSVSDPHLWIRQARRTSSCS